MRPFPFLNGCFEWALGVFGAPCGFPAGSLGVPGRSLGGSEASVWVAVSATDRFVMYTGEIINVFIICLRLAVSLTFDRAGARDPLTDIVNDI